MIETVYHGSPDRIESPVYGYGKKYNDYGRGFYCTYQENMAFEWAVAKDHDGFANKYEIDTSDLSILNLNDEKYTILHWLTILLQNREFDMPSVLAAEAKTYLTATFSLDIKGYDIIKGYRADDSYFSFAQDFLNGTISYRQLGNAMRLGKLGEQFVLKSEKAFGHIRFVSAAEAKREEWLAKKTLRDGLARRDYFDSEKNRRQKGDIYITQILDEEMKPDDHRL